MYERRCGAWVRVAVFQRVQARMCDAGQDIDVTKTQGPFDMVFETLVVALMGREWWKKTCHLCDLLHPVRSELKLTPLTISFFVVSSPSCL